MAEYMAAFPLDSFGFGAPVQLDAGIDWGTVPDFTTAPMSGTISASVFGENPPDGATGFYGGFDQLLGQISAASNTLFGVAGRGFALADQLAADATKLGSGSYTDAAAGDGSGGMADGLGLSLPVVAVAAVGIVGALWLAFR